MMEDHSVHSSSSTRLRGSPMSTYSTPGAPVSELGHLALGSSGSSGSSGKRMAPTTRSMSRRQTQASPTTFSGATSNPSRASQARSGAPSRLPSRQLSQVPEPEDDDDDDDDDESGSDDDDSDDDSEDDGGAEALARQKTMRVFDIYALSEPNNLVGAELMLANGNSEETTRMHQRLASLTAHQARVNPVFWDALLQMIQIPGPSWSQMMIANLTKRMVSIFDKFQRGLSGPTQGADVISTAEALRDLVNAIDRITANGYWNGTNDGSRRSIASLLLVIVEQVVAHDMDANDYTPGPQPSYAGQTAEHTNLYQRLIGNSPTGGFGVALLRRLDTDGRLLARYSQRLVELHQNVITKYAYVGHDGRMTAINSRPNPTVFIQALGQLKNNAQRQAG